ncbi:MAG: HetP family heterocyst commitment protein [Leptolyngbyaceae cyanobacterium MO_188.B28]|nr:HetP family heterocyst commitment protein [Leptolyngbyaceae cyanobacterium MO_188.B28]
MAFKSALNSSKLDKIMSPEQFDQVVEAILAGKYSWACVLILRFAGYNPLHYIPYRTYNRLMKDHRQGGRLKKKTSSPDPKQAPSPIKAGQAASVRQSRQITDLTYLEPVNHHTPQVQGGSAHPLLADLHPLMRELEPETAPEDSYLIRLALEQLTR